jgi:hypothetical protein
MAAAVKGVMALGEGLAGMVGVAGTAVKVTAEVAQKAVDATGVVAGAAVDAAGVLGTATLDATRVIGKAGLETTAAVAQSGLQIATKTAETTAAVADSGLKLVEKTADTAEKVGSAALDATTVASTAVLETTGVTVKAATDALQAGVTAAGTLVTTSLNGFKELNKRIAARGALTTAKWAEQQKAEGKAFNEIGAREVAGEKMIEEFMRLADQMKAGVKQIIAVQQSTLAGNINMYKGTQCGWWKRKLGMCTIAQVKVDTDEAKLAVRTLLDTFEALQAETARQLGTGNDNAPKLIPDFVAGVDVASRNFALEFKALTDKYIQLVRAGLRKLPPPSAAPPVAAAAAGRRRKTSRASRTRRVVRGRRALRRVTGRGKRGT